MTDQLRARTTGAPARGCLWAWIRPQPTGRELCPADRGRCARGTCWHRLRAEPGAALFEVVVPAERVLASDYVAWHCALNRWYLADEDEERRLEARWVAGEEDAETDFEERLRSRLGPRYADRSRGPGSDPFPQDLEAELRASWERAFVPATGPFPPGASVQAVVAELRRADVARWRPVVRREGRVRLGAWQEEGAGVGPVVPSDRQHLGH